MKIKKIKLKTRSVPSDLGRTDLEGVGLCEVDGGPARDRDVDVDELCGDVTQREE